LVHRLQCPAAMGHTNAGKDPKQCLLQELVRAARGLTARTVAAQARSQFALYEWDRAVRRNAGPDAHRS